MFNQLSCSSTVDLHPTMSTTTSSITHTAAAGYGTSQTQSPSQTQYEHAMANNSPLQQQRGPKLQKCRDDQDASNGVELEIDLNAATSDSAIQPYSQYESSTTEPVKARLELSHYFFPTESGEWKLSPIEFERYGLKSPISSMNDQSVNDALMFPVLPPVWKRDQLYVPESFKNEQSRVPLEERTNKIMYDVDQPSRPHRRMVLPQIYPNAVQTEQLNLLVNKQSILHEFRKSAPLTVGRDDPSIQALFRCTTDWTINGTVVVNDSEMKDSSSFSSSSTTSTAGVQAEIDAAASKCYSFDYSLAPTNPPNFDPFLFHFHAQPLACERERKISDEDYFNDLLLAKQVQEKVKILIQTFTTHESTNHDTFSSPSKNSAVTSASNYLRQFSSIYRDLNQTHEPSYGDIVTIPTGELALFLATFVSESKHELNVRQFACELLLRHLLSPRFVQLETLSEDEEDDEEEADEDNDDQQGEVQDGGDEDEGEDMEEENEEKEEEGQQDEPDEDVPEGAKFVDGGSVEHATLRAHDESKDFVDDKMQPLDDGLSDEEDAAAKDKSEDTDNMRSAANGDEINEAAADEPTSSSNPSLPKSAFDSVDTCLDRLDTFGSCSKFSNLNGVTAMLKRKPKLVQQLRVGELLRSERSAIKGLLFQFALMKTDEILLSSIIQVSR